MSEERFTKEELAAMLSDADMSWRAQEGYTGRPVRTSRYWQFVARSLLGRGVNHRKTFEATMQTAKQEMDKRDEDAIATFCDLKNRLEDWKNYAAEVVGILDDIGLGLYFPEGRHEHRVLAQAAIDKLERMREEDREAFRNNQGLARRALDSE